MTDRLHSFGLLQKRTSAKARTWHAVLTSGIVDHVGDRIYVPGIDLSTFKANPVALASHDSRSFPVGRWEDLSVIGAGWAARLEADLVLAEAGTSEVADEAAGLVDQKILRGVSIGFTSQRSEPNDAGGLDYLQTTLVEASLVSVPANEEALIAASFFGSNPPKSTSTERVRRFRERRAAVSIVAETPAAQVVRLVPGPAKRVLLTRKDLPWIAAGIRSAVAAEVEKAVRHATGRLDP